ncbi:hypothetical protein BS47DRAFT_140402 [Hydnum rufescens UP504]|uniref:SET domain-containing protein n=1 Tax=Hydnum rufescens UP504 TaxID=1448309 RepID=A0A9P6APL9_9AGAM|nr:hypothetical protein BS47DRAFT_140402 [Hydnum rufescens UP504]
MVPIADAFNHIEEHNIHLESGTFKIDDYHVCSTCGSLAECPHDSIEDKGNEDRRGSHPPSDGGQPSLTTHVDDVCEMVTNSAILTGDEIFNSYDSRLSNTQLMIQYGFMLEGNSNDLLKWDLDEIDTILHYGSEDEEEGWFSRMRIWAAIANMELPPVDVSHLLFTTSPPVSSALGEDGLLPRAIRGRKEAPVSPSRDNNIDPRLCLSINADAQVSQQLWLYLAIQRLPPCG